MLPPELSKAYRYLQRTRVSSRFIVISVVLYTVTVLLNLYLFTLFFPLVKGIIIRDFSEVASLAVLRRVIELFPRVSGSQPALFMILVGWVYVLSLVKSAIGYALSLVVRREAMAVARQMRVIVLDRYLRFGKLFFDRNDTSTLAWRAASCNDWIENLFVSMQLLLSRVFELLVYLSIMAAISWKLTASALIAVPLFRLGNALLRRIQALSIRYSEVIKDLHLKLTDVLSFLTLVRTSGQTENERRRFTNLCAEEIKVGLRAHRLASLRDPVQEITGTTSLLLMALCFSFLTHGQVDSARLFVFFFLAMRAIPAMNSIGHFRASIAREAASAEAFDSLMRDDDKFIVPSGPRPYTGPFSGIEVRRLNFSYRPEYRILRDLSLTVSRGDVLGLVGPTGAGKTTLVHLLLRLYDCPAGTIFLDGVDIRDFDIESLRTHIAFMGQDAPVMNDTIRANILYSTSGRHDEADLARVVEKSRLSELIARLPEGLDTVTGERGVMLSGGERQRIAIARAFMKNAEILILDEPTSALDPVNERLIAEATHELMRGRTTIVIAHRMSTIRRATSIAFLDGGTVVQSGPYDRVSSVDGPFRRFLVAQGLADSEPSTV